VHVEDPGPREALRAGVAVAEHRETGVRGRARARSADRWWALADDPQILALRERPRAAELRGLAPLAECEAPLLEELAPELAIATWRAGSTLYEEGALVDLAFFVLEGEVALHLPRDPGTPVAPIFEATRAGGAAPAARHAARRRARPAATRPRRVQPSPRLVPRLSARPPAEATAEAPLRLGPGEACGEIAGREGWPQPMAACTTRETTLLQVPRPALRALRRGAPRLREGLDADHRERGLVAELRALPLLGDLDDVTLRMLRDQAGLAAAEAGDVIAREGEPADAFFLVRSGFVGLEQRFGGGELVVSHLSRGMALGDFEALLEDGGVWQATARAAGPVDLLTLRRAELVALLAGHPDLEARLWESATARIREAGASRRELARAELVAEGLARGLVQARSLLAIDLETCTRCDDCVRACAATHGGRPRLAREGTRLGPLLATTGACLHCLDPVCLVGCPTGAIRRGGDDVVRVDDATCIGCGVCAARCPFDAIAMHDTGERWPADAYPDALRGEPRLVASKCDLCRDAGHEPACVSSCPHGSASRVDALPALVARATRGEAP
jgi:Fe-S-cluster-containing hydrogenase component 2